MTPVGEFRSLTSVDTASSDYSAFEHNELGEIEFSNDRDLTLRVSVPADGRCHRGELVDASKMLLCGGLWSDSHLGRGAASLDLASGTLVGSEERHATERW